MKFINITGATQKIFFTHKDKYGACYICNNCGLEFASVEDRETEAEAKDMSYTRFDAQQRSYCYFCGFKLTDKE